MEKTNPFKSSGLFVNTSDVWTPFKASFEGFAGSGKSYTMYLLAIGIWEAEGKTSNIVLIDTEKSAKFAIPVFKAAGLIEGQNLFVSQSRSLIDFNKALRLANENRAILLVDSVTHLYEEMTRAFSEQKRRPVTYPQDAMILKPMWKEQFTNPFVNAQNCHIIFTGRAAWEYRMSINETTGKKEFNAEGVKMRGDNETAFEPDLLVLMEREQDIDKDGNVVPYRLATILKFRSPVMDGKQFRNPTWKDFEPAYRVVASGAQIAEKQQPAESDMGALFQRGNAEAFFLQRQRAERLVEEIKAAFDQWGLGGTGAMEKAIRANLYQIVFNNRTTNALAEMNPVDIERGKDLIEYLARHAAKNIEFIQAMFKNGELEGVHEYFVKASHTYQIPAPEDAIPNFETEQKTEAEPDTKSLAVSSILNTIMEASTSEEVDELVNVEYAEIIAKMNKEDRDLMKLAQKDRKKQLKRSGAAQPELGM